MLGRVRGEERNRCRGGRSKHNSYNAPHGLCPLFMFPLPHGGPTSHPARSPKYSRSTNPTVLLSRRPCRRRRGPAGEAQNKSHRRITGTLLGTVIRRMPTVGTSCCMRPSLCVALHSQIQHGQPPYLQGTGMTQTSVLQMSPHVSPQRKGIPTRQPSSQRTHHHPKVLVLCGYCAVSSTEAPREATQLWGSHSESVRVIFSVDWAACQQGANAQSEQGNR